MEDNQGEFTHHTMCPSCGSSDGRAVYDNGSSYCFVCGKWSKTDNTEQHIEVPRGEVAMRDTLLMGEYQAFKLRRLSEKTCRKFNYTLGVDSNNNICQIATYYNNDKKPIAQKLRYADKAFKFIGAPKQSTLFGQQLWGEKGLKLTITEGEIDAMSVYEGWGGKDYPVVSIANGAQSAKKELSKHLEWINSFDEVYLWFDNDDAGLKAVEECIPLFPAGKVKVIQHSTYKDASEVLQNEGAKGIVQTFYNAKEFRPDGIITAGDIAEEAMKPTEWGQPWCFEGVTNATYGRRLGELHLLGAGVGIGKTDYIMAQIAYDITKANLKVGTFMLEQTPVETLKRIAGKIDGKHYHLPNEDETVYKNSELSNTISEINKSGNLYMYNSFGAIDWEVIKTKIRIMHHNLGVRHFYLDNITAIVAQAGDERRFLDSFMEELASLCQELSIWILAISHLTTPSKGDSHEEGGRVEAKQFTGSRALMRWAHYMFGLERNNQHEDVEERKKTILRCLKDRFSGQATGKTFCLKYDSETGLLKEVDEEFILETEEVTKEEDF